MIAPDRFTPGLPWGWWLRVSGTFVEDDHGRQWHSVREAFWRGELGFPYSDAERDQQELLLRALASINARVAIAAEQREDLFGGNYSAWKFHQCWLASIGLVEVTSHSSPGCWPLSAKGNAVLLMLQATRQPEWEGVPFAEVVADVVAATRNDDDLIREKALDAFERGIGLRRHTFCRERVGPSYLVTLTTIATDARMPTRRVTWSQFFSDNRARDQLYAWLAQRVDCWDAWGEIAYRKGADAFASRLLGLIVEDGGLIV